MSGRSFHELIKITVATVITGVLHIVGITIFWGRMPASYYLIGIMLQFFLTVGVRLPTMEMRTAVSVWMRREMWSAGILRFISRKQIHILQLLWQ
ncbi:MULTISPECIES: hypothetical protein [Blautia]|uniref:hypothetical protein n=1 Tax=Blautia TaxID=572511 RepID=UPI00156D614A|nr:MULTISPECIES: hypothetical protein [Blautia]MCQ4801701.1 hypothetical protein [Blautia sp. MSK.18.38]NSJ98677.1 hypothetical protein [Blautia massiliensis (ex Durand et al. 2017)]